MKQHILVVDDQEPIRELLAAYFSRHGYHVATAGTGGEALALANESPLHLIILDIGLADVDGLELLSLLKQNHSKLPVLILTGMGFAKDLLQDARRRGADGYVSKTLQLDQLLTEVERMITNVGE